MEARQFYNNQLNKLIGEISSLKKRLRALSLLRLSVFLGLSFCIYLFWGNLNLIGLSSFFGIIGFLVLVSIYTNVKNKLRFATVLQDINLLEVDYLNGDFSQTKTGKEYIFETHDFNQDIDLFGEGSLFQRLNRTALKHGEEELASILNSNDPKDIKAKQEAIKELAELAEWRQKYTATATLIESEISSDSVLNWISNHERFVPKIYDWLPIPFSVVSVLMIAAYFTGFVSGYFVGLWFGIGAALTMKYVKKINNMYNVTSKIDDLLKQYSLLLQQIENSDFNSTILNNLQKEIKTNSVPASTNLADLSSEVSSLGNRNNMLFGFLGNGFLLWDLRYARRIENWVGSFDGALKQWFHTVEKFDAMNSLANYAFNHQDYIYPKISSDSSLQLKAENLGHPLLIQEKMVTNSITLGQHDFFIITGANMAGKSTFLRTVAMNMVMANCGLPVCAKSFEYQPMKLISSMRTSDSLMNDESYFFSELKRLKFIIERIENDSYFIILDEILKGTNSVDKAEGSKKFVERLVRTKSTGLIATHDLSLCTLSNDYEHIKNHYFDAEIVNNELHFDYRFKDGVCQNMNASFLLKKMGITE